MDQPPPVPPKDQHYLARMEADRLPSAPRSGSKRKREPPADRVYDVRERGIDAADPESHTPKRDKARVRRNEADVSDDATPVQQRSIRRKKGSRNLSHLNLRHAAEKQAQEKTHTRGSKFQEGSLTDKPSEKPPSVYTRMVRTESGNLEQVDQLMDAYYDDGRESTDCAVGHDTSLNLRGVADIESEPGRRDENAGFFRFGRHLAANFHPAVLWNRIWNESKEESAQQNLEEVERKTRLKAEAEAKYAQMKRDGQLGLQPVGHTLVESGASRDVIATPGDPGTAVDGGTQSPFEQPRSATTPFGFMMDDDTSRSGSEIPETTSKPGRGFRSRLHLKQPSLNNIRNGLKRVTSELNLSAAATPRESSSSVSPVKAEFDNSALRSSHSKFDLKKKQKLSKRVSDLEVKLQLARRELDDALVEASPMPKLDGKHERFAPSGTLRRLMFMPGRLPSLPSERILMAEQMESHAGGDNNVNGHGETRACSAMGWTEVVHSERSEEDQETIKAHPQSYPRRASSLFNLKNEAIKDLPLALEKAKAHEEGNVSENLIPVSEVERNMDPKVLADAAKDDATRPVTPGDYSTLDAKLKALEANVRAAKKSAKPKKRKSGVDDDDKLFTPDNEPDDDFEWQNAEQTPKKKRKAAGGNGATETKSRLGGAKAKSSPKSKRGKSGGSKTNGPSLSPASEKKSSKKAVVEEETQDESRADAGVAKEHSGEEATVVAPEQAPDHNGEDTQARLLEPVYEEEEESTAVPLNERPSKPTSKGTAARYGRHNPRSRSTSPHKRADSTPPGAEEQTGIQDAEVAQEQRGSQGPTRSRSPPPVNGYKSIEDEEVVTAVPGQGDVPPLPKGTNGCLESLDENPQITVTEVEALKSVTETDVKESFEWPDDVF